VNAANFEDEEVVVEWRGGATTNDLLYGRSFLKNVFNALFCE
jgi:hypothetical protein